MAIEQELWSLAVDTYGGGPLVLLLCLAQLSYGFWVVRENLRARKESSSGLDPADRRVRALQRVEIWTEKVRPVVMALMLLGPGVGIGWSTLLGSIGLSTLAGAMSGQQELLIGALTDGYREVAMAYLLMVFGTIPMVLGPLILLVARRFEQQVALLQGGDREDLLLETARAQLELQRDQRRAHDLANERLCRLLENLVGMQAQLSQATLDRKELR